MTGRIVLLYQNTIQVNGTVAADRKREEKFDFSFISDVTYLNFLESAKLESRLVSVGTDYMPTAAHIKS